MSVAEECYKFVHDDAKLGRFFEEDAKLVLRKQELMEKRDRLSKANAAMANIQVLSFLSLFPSSDLLFLPLYSPWFRFPHSYFSAFLHVFFVFCFSR